MQSNMQEQITRFVQTTQILVMAFMSSWLVIIALFSSGILESPDEAIDENLASILGTVGILLLTVAEILPRFLKVESDKDELEEHELSPLFAKITLSWLLPTALREGAIIIGGVLAFLSGGPGSWTLILWLFGCVLGIAHFPTKEKVLKQLPAAVRQSV